MHGLQVNGSYLSTWQLQQEIVTLDPPVRLAGLSAPAKSELLPLQIWQQQRPMQQVQHTARDGKPSEFGCASTLQPLNRTGGLEIRQRRSTMRMKPSDSPCSMHLLGALDQKGGLVVGAAMVVPGRLRSCTWLR